MNYRDNDELRYFGSDLNKWINEKCSKKMTAINIDLLMYKRSKLLLRIIESKHQGEDIPYSQIEVLNVLAKIANLIRPLLDKVNLLDFNVYIVEANYPYDYAEIADLCKRQIYVLRDEKFQKWLEFDYSFTETDLKIEEEEEYEDCDYIDIDELNQKMVEIEMQMVGCSF